MTLRERERLIVVLVRARNPANIGAVARAMHDLGYRHLRIVNEYPVPFQAAKSAVHASSVLAAATDFPTLATAVADCTLVLGTTAVGARALSHPLWVLEEAADRCASLLAAPGQETRIALLFGSEKTGLSNDELSHCHALVTIPMNPVEGDQHLSMNLGQAAAVCLYTLAARTPQPVLHTADEPPASSGELERLTSLLAELFESSGYTRRYPANARSANLRRMVRRMGLRAADVPVWTGVLRQLLYALSPRARATSLSTRPGQTSDEEPRL